MTNVTDALENVLGDLNEQGINIILVNNDREELIKRAEKERDKAKNPTWIERKDPYGVIRGIAVFGGTFVALGIATGWNASVSLVRDGFAAVAGVIPPIYVDAKKSPQIDTATVRRNIDNDYNLLGGFIGKAKNIALYLSGNGQSQLINEVLSMDMSKKEAKEFDALMRRDDISFELAMLAFKYGESERYLELTDSLERAREKGVKRRQSTSKDDVDDVTRLTQILRGYNEWAKEKAYPNEEALQREAKLRADMEKLNFETAEFIENLRNSKPNFDNAGSEPHNDTSQAPFFEESGDKGSNNNYFQSISEYPPSFLNNDSDNGFVTSIPGAYVPPVGSKYNPALFPEPVDTTNSYIASEQEVTGIDYNNMKLLDVIKSQEVPSGSITSQGENNQRGKR